MEQQRHRGRFLDQAGFTIGETLIGLILTAVLLLAASPVVGDLLATYHLRGATHEIFGELQRARLAAVMQNNPFGFSVMSGSGAYKIHDDRDKDYVEDEGEVSLRAVEQIAGGVRLSGDRVVTFLANGTALSGGVITVTNARGDSRRIEIGAGGNIRIL